MVKLLIQQTEEHTGDVGLSKSSSQSSSDKDLQISENDRSKSLMRLTNQLLDRRTKIVTNKRVAVIGLKWTSLLVARLSASSVRKWDKECNKLELQLLQHIYKFINQPSSNQICRVEPQRMVGTLVRNKRFPVLCTF